MGTWGPGLFDDDDAADLRDEYQGFLAEAQSAEGAADLAMVNYGADLGRLQDSSAFWLALASLQWKSGRLDPRVLAAAVRIIDEGIDLAKWEGSPLVAKRKAMLKKLQAQVTAPCPPAKALPKPPPVQLPGWEFGEVVAYRMPTSHQAVLHVLNYKFLSTAGVKAPVVTVLNWFGDQLPDEAAVRGLTYINHNGTISLHHLLSLAMPRSRALRDAQFQHLGMKKPVTRDEASSAVCGIGGHEGLTLEISLKRVLGMYWDDPTLPVHFPKNDPTNIDPADTPMVHLRQMLFGQI